MKGPITDPVIKLFISIIGLVVVSTVLRELQHIFIPFVIAYFLFFVFTPLNNYLKKNKIPSVFTILADLIIIIGIIWGISRVILDSFSRFGLELPIYEAKLNKIISTSAQSMGISDPFFTEFQLVSMLKEIDYSGLAGGFFTSTLSIFSAGFFVLFFFIFIIGGHDRMIDVIKKRYIDQRTNLSEGNGNNIASVDDTQNEELAGDQNHTIEALKSDRARLFEKTFKDITGQIQNYLATKFLISLMTATIVSLALWIFGVDFLIVWGVLSFLFNFIPNIGSIIAVILPTLMTLVQFESFGYTLIVAAVIVSIQNIIGNIIEPKIMGERLGLNPLVILISLLIWGYIWGIVGMFLSVPLTAIIKIIFSRSHSETLTFISDLMGN